MLSVAAKRHRLIRTSPHRLSKLQKHLFRHPKIHRHERRLNGDLSPHHRRLSSDGSLNLTIDGRGYFQYRLRTYNTYMGSDFSQSPTGQVPVYDNAYMSYRPPTSPEIMAVQSISIPTTDIAAQIAGVGTFIISSNTSRLFPGDQVIVSGSPCAAAGTYTVRTAGTVTGGLDVREAIRVQSVGDICTATETADVSPQQNSPSWPGNQRQDDHQGVENTNENDDEAESQVVYSHDGSMHVNKYGFLVDDNGLLLVVDSSPTGGGVQTDANAKFHAHIPSRASEIIVTPNGKILAREGQIITVGQIHLVRFENPSGLDIRLEMKSGCAAANEDGFALGTWCIGTKFDGKDHTYYSETLVSGIGILGKPGYRGFGWIETA